MQKSVLAAVYVLVVQESPFGTRASSAVKMVEGLANQQRLDALDVAANTSGHLLHLLKKLCGLVALTPLCRSLR